MRSFEVSGPIKTQFPGRTPSWSKLGPQIKRQLGPLGPIQLGSLDLMYLPKKSWLCLCYPHYVCHFEGHLTPAPLNSSLSPILKIQKLFPEVNRI